MKKLLNQWAAAWRGRPTAVLADSTDEWLRRLREAGL
jgi:hypothetical protein